MFSGDGVAGSAGSVETHRFRARTMENTLQGCHFRTSLQEHSSDEQNERGTAKDSLVNVSLLDLDDNYLQSQAAENDAQAELCKMLLLEFDKSVV